MVRIRLRRMGAKKRPFYRIIVADARSPRDGRFIETLGYYDPLTEPKTVKINAEKYHQWIRHGAQPSESVVGILKRSRALEAPAEPAPVTAAAYATAAAPAPAQAQAPAAPGPEPTAEPAESAPVTAEATAEAATETPTGGGNDISDEAATAL